MYRSRKRMNPSPCAAVWPLVGRRWRRESVPTVRAARSGRSWRSEIVGCAQPHPWLLSTIATAIATWLGALSRNHGRRAHRMGGCYRAGEVLRKSTRGNYGKRVSRTTQKTAHRVRTAHRTACTACRTSPRETERERERERERAEQYLKTAFMYSPIAPTVHTPSCAMEIWGGVLGPYNNVQRRISSS